MKIRNFVLVIILLFIAQDFAFADRQLDRTEILQIFKMLTDQPKQTWIPSGTITATHHEYKSSNGYMTDSIVTVKYDGDRFYWEINVDSHTKQQNNSKPSQDSFDLNWNKKRVFVWDGERYTMYFRPGNQAIVHENPRDIPVAVNGPLTAGIVLWGYGVFTLENLSAAESSAKVDAEGHIHLRLNKTSAPEMVFVLDPAKDYALLSSLMDYAGGSSVTKIYGDYETILGKWVPTTIIIERHDNSKQPPELLSRDYWDFTSISPILPQTNSFRVPYETDALVEFYTPVSKKALWYRYYSEVDTDSLLQQKLEIALTKDSQSQNCATMAMKYVSERLGKNATDQDLAKLVSEPNKSTSLYALRQFARDLDLYCLAVKTDLATLKSLKNCQAILHLPRANHYVVFEYIDDEYVWVIDLDSNRFFYRTKLRRFGLNWSAGTALLVSDKPLDPDPNDTLINDSELHKIIGSTEGGFTNFTCEEKIQDGDIIQCPVPPVGSLCGGQYIQFFERCGCTPGDEGDECEAEINPVLPGNVSTPCVDNGQGGCASNYVFYFQDIRACLPCDPD
ncbi:MAG: hypothetical protein FVQ85_20000 [Planctomycetes bacterium]|nr:hypothetical protein [Planctomycetota bacterium]